MSNNTNSATPVGVALIAAGGLFLISQSVGFDLWPSGKFWPLFIMIPGALLLAFASLDKSFSKALAPFAMMVTLTGCVLAYQAWANHFQSWAYAWIIVGPFALGTGLAWHGRMHGDEQALRDGRQMALFSILSFFGAAAVFELVFNISGFGLSVDLPSGIFLPVVLIAGGGVLLLRQSKKN